MREHFFAGLDGLPRGAKPRTKGLTMVIDWGLGPHAQEDLLATGAEYADLAKVAVGVSRLLDTDLLRAKIENYQVRGVEPFPGGQYLEYAEISDLCERYLPAVCAAGYRWVEVSDNLAPVGLEWKARMIGQAVGEYGLAVLGEVGQKEGLKSGVPMADDAKTCLDAGARIVLLEAAELVSTNAETAREVERVIEAVGLERVMFELPGPWIEGVALHDVHRLRRELLRRYGSEVNMGNVSPDELMVTETLRRGLGANAGGEEL
jgi:phosphosulfolactate synthase